MGLSERYRTLSGHPYQEGENRGEIERALEGKLPHLIKYEEVKEDLHVHTTWSDGSYSVKEMAEAAKLLGDEYLAICDHSKTLQIAHGLTEEDLLKQIGELEKLPRNGRLPFYLE